MGFGAHCHNGCSMTGLCFLMAPYGQLSMDSRRCSREGADDSSQGPQGIRYRIVLRDYILDVAIVVRDLVLYLMGSSPLSLAQNIKEVRVILERV